MDRSLTELNVAFDSLLARVNQLDGASLSDAAESTTGRFTAELEGLRETVNQVVLTLDAHLNDVQTSVTELQLLLQRHLGVGS